MSVPIIFKVTDAGRQAALDAQNTGLNLHLAEIGLGAGKYVPLANRTTLAAPIGRWPLSGGDIEPNSDTLRFYASIDATINVDAFEVGIFDAHGVLFAVASTTGADPLMVLSANITFLATFGMSLADLSSSNIMVVTDPNAPLALVLHQQHLAAPNPHPQYTLMTLFQQLVATVASLTEELMSTQALVAINAAINLIQERLTALEQRPTAQSAIDDFVSGNFEVWHASLAQGDGGYQKLPNGLILQWGRIDLPVTDLDNIRIAFPITFPSACYNIQTSVYQQDSNLAGDGAFHVKSIDVLGGNVFLQTYNSQTGTGNLNGFYWSAIGH